MYKNIEKRKDIIEMNNKHIKEYIELFVKTDRTFMFLIMKERIQSSPDILKRDDLNLDDLMKIVVSNKAFVTLHIYDDCFQFMTGFGEDEKPSTQMTIYYEEIIRLHLLDIEGEELPLFSSCIGGMETKDYKLENSKNAFLRNNPNLNK